MSFELFPIEQQEFDRIVTLFDDDINDELSINIMKDFDYNKNNKLIGVVIDPGHGGVDPGAQVNTIREADLMLSLP